MPTSPLPPEHLLAGVGFGDFEEIGRETAELIARFSDLRPGDRVLDIGYGLGRITRYLADMLPNGTYDGIDTVPEYHQWCSTGMGLDPERFRFRLADIYSSHYNPTGTLRAETLTFPWPDQTFTLVIATSLFTHLSAAATENYLREVFRVLKPGGRFFASFFVLDGYARRNINFGETVPRFAYEFEHGLIESPDNPELAVAFDSEWLLHAFQSTGFEITAFHRGKWRRQKGPSYQDLVVARR